MSPTNSWIEINGVRYKCSTLQDGEFVILRESHTYTNDSSGFYCVHCGRPYVDSCNNHPMREE